jgi:hypothetical protein
VSFGSIDRIKRIIRLLFAGHFFAAAQSGSQPIDEITAALRSRECRKAAQLLRAPLQRSPQDPRLWTLQGMALGYVYIDVNTADYGGFLDQASQVGGMITSTIHV